MGGPSSSNPYSPKTILAIHNQVIHVTVGEPEPVVHNQVIAATRARAPCNICMQDRILKYLSSDRPFSPLPFLPISMQGNLCRIQINYCINFFCGLSYPKCSSNKTQSWCCFFKLRWILKFSFLGKSLLVVVIFLGQTSNPKSYHNAKQILKRLKCFGDTLHHISMQLRTQ